MGKLWGEGVEDNLGRLLQIEPSRHKSSHNNSEQTFVIIKYKKDEGFEGSNLRFMRHRVSVKYIQRHPFDTKTHSAALSMPCNGPWEV